MRHSIEQIRWSAFYAVLVRWRIALFMLGLIALVICDLVWLSRGIGPASLWLDDQWVGALVIHASPAELLALKPPAPLGFILLLKLITNCFGWGSVQLQILPVIFGLVQIPLIGWIAFRATDRVSLGLVAAVLLAGSRPLMVFSLRVKQYTMEGLIVLILIALAMICMRRPRASTLALVIVAAILSLPFSFTAIPVGLVIVNMLALHLWFANRTPNPLSRRSIFLACSLYNAVVLVWLGFFQSHQPNSMMFTYWADHYLPLHDPSALWDFARTDLFRFLSGSLPSIGSWLALVAPVGVILLLWRKPSRMIGAALLLFYAGLIALSALQLYPLGGRRTDVFSFPITILAIMGALWVLSRFLKFLPQLVLCGAILQMYLWFPDFPLDYPRYGGRGAVEKIMELANDDDGLIIAPQSSWVFGCYGNWPVDLVKAADSTNGFIVKIQRPNTLLLRQSMLGEVPGQDSEFNAQLETFLNTRPPRIFYISIHSWTRADETVTRPIESHGYVGTELPIGAPGLLVLFEQAKPN